MLRLPFFRGGKSKVRNATRSRNSSGSRPTRSHSMEQLEVRCLLSTFTVSNLNDSGAGSLRQAIVDANAATGADVIDFSVAGSIDLTSAALPTITGQLHLNGASATGFASAPVVEIEFHGFSGLQFDSAADGSVLRSLGLVHASGAGVDVNGADSVLITGNYIGLGLDGTTIQGNAGDGVVLHTSMGSRIVSNVISGNAGTGVRLDGAHDSLIQTNVIGADATGSRDLGNGLDGILVTQGSTGNTIGGNATGVPGPGQNVFALHPQGNLISGNGAYGVHIAALSTGNEISGNFIGVTGSGNAALGNALDGVKIENSDGNLIGQEDPVTGVTYYNADSVPMQPVSGWEGLRATSTSGQYLISGTSGDNGSLFIGTIAGVGTSYAVDFPNAEATSVYGPDSLDNGVVRLVGSYRNADALTAPVTVNGFVFEGTTAQLTDASHYRTIAFPGSKYNYVHSTMGGLAVGNYDSPLDHGTNSLPLGPGHAYIYNIATGQFVTDIVVNGAISNTAYGIWWNGGTSYTIAGGYSLNPVNNLDDQNRPIGKAYLIDYDSATGVFSHATTFDDPRGTNYITHFEGISMVEKGIYTLNADSVQTGTGDPAQGSWVTVRRHVDGSFGPAAWVNLNYPGLNPTTHITSSNSVSGNQVVGIVIGGSADLAYQATINTGFQLSNVISGNGGNGITLDSADNNRIAMNNIGTDSTGTLGLANARNGILVTNGATNNLIGGDASGENDPTGGVFERPPQGNLISANNANGVHITGQATGNVLSGNFIGTVASGNFGLGNAQDGVLIENANGNSLLGCLATTDPFIFYNVISGNRGNGLRVKNSNDTTIQANFFGLGANNQTPVGNQLNGVVIEGSSARTTMGGPIPLGNVVAANGQNGIVIQDTASGFISYNTFCGLAAFQTYTNLGNGADGFLITSTGGNILLRTNVITENGDDGIEISGQATGVTVTEDIIGLDTNGEMAMGNQDNGIEVGGNAHGIVIGSRTSVPSVIPRNIIAGNRGNGVAITGTAHGIQVYFAYIGTDIHGTAAIGNAKAGVFVGPGTSGNTIGSTDSTLPTVISGNIGDGVQLSGTSGNTVAGTLIGVNALNNAAMPNGGNGVNIINSSGNTIGGTGATSANVIANSAANGVLVQSGNNNGILRNSIYGNTQLGIDLQPGANNNQAAPVLTAVDIQPSGIKITGTLNSTANTQFTIQYFASDVAGSSGRVFLGSQTVTTNGAGLATLSFNAASPSAGAKFITATATNPNKNTSEFSTFPDPTNNDLSGLLRVYNLVNVDKNVHFYTTNKGEYDALLAMTDMIPEPHHPWQDAGEDSSFALFQTPPAGANVAYVQRLYNTDTSEHYFTLSLGEAAALASMTRESSPGSGEFIAGWVWENQSQGTTVTETNAFQGYMYLADNPLATSSDNPVGPAGTLPVFRLYQDGTGSSIQTGQHVLTNDTHLIDTLLAQPGWSEQGMLGFAVPLTTPSTSASPTTQSYHSETIPVAADDTNVTTVITDGTPAVSGLPSNGPTNNGQPGNNQANDANPFGDDLVTALNDFLENSWA